MTWRGSTPPQDRIFACLPYLLPLAGSVIFGVSVLNQLPPALAYPFALIAQYITPLTTGLLGLAIFFALFLLVVRNQNISHFVRFNTMQALLLDILLVGFGFVLQLLGQGLGSGILITVIYNTLFIGAVVACVYSVVQSVLGRYAEIPTLSDAVYAQVRY